MRAPRLTTNHPEVAQRAFGSTLPAGVSGGFTRILPGLPRRRARAAHVDGQRYGDGARLLLEAAKLPDGPGERMLGPVCPPPLVVRLLAPGDRIAEQLVLALHEPPHVRLRRRTLELTQHEAVTVEPSNRRRVDVVDEKKPPRLAILMSW